MGKLILVSGENSSGKSVFAENLLARYDGKRYYIATMIPETEENFARIEKHKNQRADLDFITFEFPYCVNDDRIESASAVLLEDVSNLLGNNIFDKGRGADAVFDDIMALVQRCEVLVAVTISGLESQQYDADTAKYIDSINKINQKLYDTALVAITMKDGKPVYEKGENYEIV